MGVGPLIDSSKTARKRIKKSRKVAESRKGTITKVIISISKIAETRSRESLRDRRAVKIKEKRSKNGTLRHTERDSESIRPDAAGGDATPQQCFT